MPTYLFWLIPLVLWVAAMLTLEWLAVTPIREQYASRYHAHASRYHARPARRTRQPSKLGDLAHGLKYEVRGEELGRYFFLPSVDEAWREVCRKCDGQREPMSHPLIDEALDEIAISSNDDVWHASYKDFARAYTELRTARLARCVRASTTP